MDNLWVKVIKTTGAVGVVAFLIYIVTNNIFSENIISLFGSNKMFILTMGIISVLLITLLVAVIKSKESRGLSYEPDGPIKSKGKPDLSNKSDGPKVTYRDKSTHNGNNNF